jgi:hypothetical protein
MADPNKRLRDDVHNAVDRDHGNYSYHGTSSASPPDVATKNVDTAVYTQPSAKAKSDSALVAKAQASLSQKQDEKKAEAQAKALEYFRNRRPGGDEVTAGAGSQAAQNPALKGQPQPMDPPGGLPSHLKTGYPGVGSPSMGGGD